MIFCKTETNIPNFFSIDLSKNPTFSNLDKQFREILF